MIYKYTNYVIMRLLTSLSQTNFSITLSVYHLLSLQYIFFGSDGILLLVVGIAYIQNIRPSNISYRIVNEW